MLSFELAVNEQVKLVAECATLSDEDFVEEKGLPGEARFTIYRVTDTSKIEIGATSFSPMPGCCGMVVSHYTYLNERTRGQGLSNTFRSLKAKMARDMGYTMMIATTQMENIPAVGNFFKSKYNIVQTFVNKRTDKLLAIGLKRL